MNIQKQKILRKYIRLKYFRIRLDKQGKEIMNLSTKNFSKDNKKEYFCLGECLKNHYKISQPILVIDNKNNLSKYFRLSAPYTK